MAKKKVRWLGNSAKLEIHRLVEGETHDARCHLEDIKPEHQVFSKTAKALRALGYDVSAFCNHFFRSRDNK